jgi:anti-anti-sigma factor
MTDPAAVPPGPNGGAMPPGSDDADGGAMPPGPADDPGGPNDPLAAMAAFEQLPTGVFVHEGPDHVFRAVNGAARTILGRRPLLGRTFREAVPDLEGQRIAELLDEVYRTGEPVTGWEWRFLVTEEATGAVTEYFLSFTTCPITDTDGRVIGLVSNVFDTTDTVRARESEQARAGEVEQRYREARDVVSTLQDSLLPEYLPVLPGVQLAAHYLVAGTEQAAGGDWFDAVPLPDGRLALIVGDVVGHGARASAVMGQLRAVLTAVLLDGHGVTESLVRLDRYVARMPAAAATTVCLAVLDPTSGEFDYASCGHPPPLVVEQTGRARSLNGPPGAPLGTAGAPPAEVRCRLEPGEVLLLYTDGLVERPDRSLAEGLEQLRVYAGDALLHGPGHMMVGAAVDRVCRLSLERMVRDGYHDDVSLIGAQLTGVTPAEFRLELVVGAGDLPVVRGQLDRWLDTLGASAEDVQAIQLAVGEAVTNAVEHAYPDGPGPVVVEGYHDTAGRACLTVTDRGRWRPPPVEPTARGRGLIMIRSCMDTAEIERTDEGTAVLMDRQLRRLPVFAAAAPDPLRVAAPSTGSVFGVRAERSARPLVAVQGPVDVATAAEFRRRVQEVGRGGSLPLAIDLSGVSHLASAGVAVLHELAEQMAADGRELTLIAPAGCPCRYVLELTGLDRLLGDQLGSGQGIRARVS